MVVHEFRRDGEVFVYGGMRFTLLRGGRRPKIGIVFGTPSGVAPIRPATQKPLITGDETQELPRSTDRPHECPSHCPSLMG